MKNINRLSGHSSIMKAGGGRQGSILVFLIVLMVVSAAIGVGMVSMFGSSVLSTFASNSARRANYLAESGLRYAISEVRNALPTSLAREASLTNIDPAPADPGYIDVNGKWFNVFPGVARYRVRVYPYWSKTAAGTGVATAAITATVPNSGFPPLYAIPTAPGGASVARLQVGPNNLVGVNSAAGAAAGSTAVTYNLASAVTLPVGVLAYANLAFPTTNASQPVTKGSAATPLVLNINAVSAIPQINGQFIDNTSGRLYTYQTARLVGSTVQLEGLNWGTICTICSITCPTACTTTTFPAGSYLVFSQAARLDATGDIAGGYIQTQKSNESAVTLFGPSSGATMPGPNQTPPALSEIESGFSGSLGALDVSKSGDRVVVQGYIATGGTHAYWAAFTRLGLTGYRFLDPEGDLVNDYIGYHVVPIADDIADNLRNTWMQYHNLSYDIQIKVGWDLNLEYAAQGVTVRWHESPLFEGMVPPGNDPYQYYQGYGITFMRYQKVDKSNIDLIPNKIKPPGDPAKKMLLLVLWQQKVDAGGVPRKDWLAYAELGEPKNYKDPSTGTRSPADPDQKVTGYQVWPDGRVNDNATIVVRVEDKFETVDGVTTRYNDIKVFYGDGSAFTFVNDNRTKDSVATNKQRARYYPKWLETGAGGTLAPINPRWPSNWFGLIGATIANWYNNPPSAGGTADPAFDYFSLTSSAPTAPYNTVTWVKNSSPRTDNFYTDGYPILLADNCTIRTKDFLLDSFPIGRKEIGLVGMGDLNSSNHTVAFDDFYIQMLGGL